jgi:hypothetical protein
MFVGLAIERPCLRRTPRPPDASHAILPRVLRFKPSRHARIPSLSCWAFGLAFEAQTKKPSSDGSVGKPPNPACSARFPASLLTRPPPCTGSIIHDFVFLVSPPCGPHLRTEPRVSPTPVVNHSSLRSGHPSTTGTPLVLNLPLDECIDNTQREMKFRERKKEERKTQKRNS